jgi:hypothetical protein
MYALFKEFVMIDGQLLPMDGSAYGREGGLGGSQPVLEFTQPYCVLSFVSIYPWDAVNAGAKNDDRFFNYELNIKKDSRLSMDREAISSQKCRRDDDTEPLVCRDLIQSFTDQEKYHRLDSAYQTSKGFEDDMGGIYGLACHFPEESLDFDSSKPTESRDEIIQDIKKIFPADLIDLKFESGQKPE